MKLEDMLQMKNFQGFEVIGGHQGLNRTVRTVSVMDAPDIYRWMKGGEFLITSGYPLKDNPDEICELIKKLDKAGASAFGIKKNRFLTDIPPRAMEIAGQLEFPLILIPQDLSFVDVINPVLSEVVNKQARKLTYSQKIHRYFTDLVLEGGSIDEILNTLTNIINKRTGYHDLFFDRSYGNVDTAVSMEYQIILDSVDRGVLYIESIEKDLKEYDKIAIEHAMTVLKLQAQNEISKSRIETRYRDEFVQDLIMNNIRSLEEIKRRGKLYKWTFESKYVVMIIDIDDLKAEYEKANLPNKTFESIREKLFSMTTNIIKSEFTSSMHTHFTDYMVFIIQLHSMDYNCFKKRIRSKAEILRSTIRKRFNYTVTVSMGQVYYSPREIHLSYEEAKKSVQISKNFGKKNHTIFFEDLGMYKLFESVAGSEEAVRFCNQALSDVIAYDGKKGTELLKTLKVLVQEDWNLKRSAEVLFIHYNTMKYRFGKLEEVLKVNLKNSDDKLSLSLAVKLQEMLD